MSAPTIAIWDRVGIGLRSQVQRQLNHWEGAAARLDDFEASASAEAWSSLERYVGVTLRAGLKEAREQLKREATAARATFNAVRTRADLDRVADQVATLRKRYLQTELLVDFYVAAVRARANPEVGPTTSSLRCDGRAHRTWRPGASGDQSATDHDLFHNGHRCVDLADRDNLVGWITESNRSHPAHVSQPVSGQHLCSTSAATSLPV